MRGKVNGFACKLLILKEKNDWEKLRNGEVWLSIGQVVLCSVFKTVFSMAYQFWGHLAPKRTTVPIAVRVVEDLGVSRP